MFQQCTAAGLSFGLWTFVIPVEKLNLEKLQAGFSQSLMSSWLLGAPAQLKGRKVIYICGNLASPGWIQKGSVLCPVLSQGGFLDRGEIVALVMLQVGMVQLLPIPPKIQNSCRNCYF